MTQEVEHLFTATHSTPFYVKKTVSGQTQLRQFIYVDLTCHDSSEAVLHDKLAQKKQLRYDLMFSPLLEASNKMNANF